ncbi:MAG: OB-fold nucleic acid binding domain-containing protein, partial [Rhodothermales bacterium]|nr:OB-fold nucleic acid binding domain-containing protein [Rhodothermales bacterium]
MHRELSEQEIVRRQALEELLSGGITPYPYEWTVTASAADLIERFDDDVNQPDEAGSATELVRASIAGRIMSKRVMGKAAFFHVQDESGRIQAYVRRDDLPEGFYNTVFKKHLDIGDIVGVEGFLFRTRM